MMNKGSKRDETTRTAIEMIFMRKKTKLAGWNIRDMNKSENNYKLDPHGAKFRSMK
jgi:hypothetical protein